MEKKISEVLVQPDPERMIEGLRDTGYEFTTAIADLIDNSIAAEATVIDIELYMNYRGGLRLAIADNGSGMNYEDLINAMKYGSAKRPHPSSLGKFGLGLKTASTAFCRRLLVTSRKGKEMEINRACWDLDHVARTSSWSLLLDNSDKQTVDHLNKITQGSGTVVVWETIDRLMKAYNSPGGLAAKKALERIINQLRDHISMVFQRFLDKEFKNAPNVEIVLNGRKVAPWDPFAVTVSDRVAFKEVPVEGTGSSFKVNAYVLPRREEFSSSEEASKAKIGNDYQGFYIYRENRLIHFADWLGMYSKEPHGSLLRVEFSFDHKLDEAFQIDIKKSQILLNSALYDYMKDQFLPAPRRAADDRYRQGQKKKAKDKAESAHAESNNNIASKQEQISSANVEASEDSKNEAVLTNKNGVFRIKLTVTSSNKPDELFVQPVDSLDDGVLFEAALIDGRRGVRINTGHPYYHKVYVPNLKSGVIVQGMDSLFWALCVAELSTIDKNTLQHFGELRFELSRILRRLVDDLPEPNLDENETE